MELISEVRLNYPRDVTFTEYFLTRTEHFGEMVALVSIAYCHSKSCFLHLLAVLLYVLVA